MLGMCFCLRARTQDISIEGRHKKWNDAFQKYRVSNEADHDKCGHLTVEGSYFRAPKIGRILKCTGKRCDDAAVCQEEEKAEEREKKLVSHSLLAS
jgi:hypothetical protein